MEVVHVPLPESLKAFVDAEAALHGYDSRADCIREILREAQDRRARVKIDALLHEGLASGIATEWTATDVANLKEELQRRHSLRSRDEP